MRTDLDLEPTDYDDTFVSDSDLMGFNRPHEIVHDPVADRVVGSFVGVHTPHTRACSRSAASSA